MTYQEALEEAWKYHHDEGLKLENKIREIYKDDPVLLEVALEEAFSIPKSLYCSPRRPR